MRTSIALTATCAVIPYLFVALVLLPGLAFGEAWDGSPFEPGETLDPGCTPSDPACRVSPTALSLESFFVSQATTTALITEFLTLGGEVFESLSGPGLVVHDGTLSLDTDGDWGGLFDGREGNWYEEHSFSTTSAAVWFSEKTSDDLSEGVHNRYYTDARVRNAVSSAVPGLTYTASTGVLSLNPDYLFPTVASSSEWDTFVRTPSVRIAAGSGLSWSGNSIVCRNVSSFEPGCLSPADWADFSGKQAPLTGAEGQIGYFKATNGFAATSSITIASNGNVGIGVGGIVPGAVLDVNGDIHIRLLKNCNSNALALGVDAAGKVVCKSISSDTRLKRDIAPLEDERGLSLVRKLTPVSFYWKDARVYGATDIQQYGFIAQDVLHTVPELVEKAGPTELTPDGTYAFNYLGLIAPLVKAVQELDENLSVLSSVVHTNRVETSELCVGSTCVSEEALLRILAEAGSTENCIAAPIPEDSSAEDTPHPEETPEPEPVASPEA